MSFKSTPKYYTILLVLLLTACAQFSSPLGGPKDSQAPVLIPEASDANYQTNFEQKQIILTFNEWIKVNNPIKEIVVSPPTSYPFKVTEKGKSVIFEFSEKEILKERATYQINFGDAIKDFTEGNIFKNFTYVFSTGDVIDSLSISGSVINAVTKKPEQDVVVSLYDNLSDTAFTTIKPFYFSKTDKDGKFKISNLRSDTFQIFAIRDKNVNYYYDNADEEIAFIDSTVFINPDTILQLNLSLFDEENTPKFIRAKQVVTGLIKINYTPFPKDYTVSIIEETDSTNLWGYSEVVNDTLLFWHSNTQLDSISLVVSNTLIQDTIKVKKGKGNFIDKVLTLDKKAENKFHKDDTIRISFDRPLGSFNPDSILVSDTSKTYKLNYVNVKDKSVLLTVDSLKDKSNYTVTLLPTSVTDIYNNSIKDTLKQNISTHDPDSFGNIKLDFTSSRDTQYIVKFMNKSSIVDTFIINGSRTISINKIIKGQYALEIIEDINRNNYWSSGDYSKKRQPERIKEVPLEELKAGWDLDVLVDIKSIFNGVEIN